MSNRPSKTSNRIEPKKDSPRRRQEHMSNERQAEEKAKISKQPLIPNRLPFDQGTSI